MLQPVYHAMQQQSTSINYADVTETNKAFPKIMCGVYIYIYIKSLVYIFIFYTYAYIDINKVPYNYFLNIINTQNEIINVFIFKFL